MPKKKLSNEEFVVAWQSAETIADAAKKTHLSKAAVAHRAARMRKAGVPLKRFKEVGARFDVEKLTEIATRSAKMRRPARE